MREIPAAFVDDPARKPGAGEKLQAKEVADERIGGEDIRMGVRLTTPWPEVRDERVPEFRMRFPCRDAEREHVVLARLGALSGGPEHSVCLPHGVVAEPTSGPRLSAYRLAHALRLPGEIGDGVHSGNRVQHLRPRRVRRVVHVLHEFVRLAPLDERPPAEVFEKSVGVLESPEEIDKRQHLRLQRIHRGVIAAPVEVFRELYGEPHRPVRDVVAVADVRRKAHGNHAFRNVGVLLRQHVVLEKKALEVCRSGKQRRSTSQKEAVAEPARALAARTIREDVNGVLRERLPRGGEYGVQRRIGRPERGGVRGRRAVFPDARLAKVEFAVERVGVDMAHCIWFKSLDAAAAWRHFETDGVGHFWRTHGRDDAPLQHFVEGYPKRPRFEAFHVQHDESGCVASDIVLDAFPGGYPPALRLAAVREDARMAESVVDVDIQIRMRVALEPALDAVNKPRRRILARRLDSDARPGRRPESAIKLEFGIRRDAFHETDGWLRDKRKSCALPVRRRTVRLAERALVAIARAFRDARRLEGREVASAASCREDAPVAVNLRLEERRVFWYVERVAVVGGDFDGQFVAPRLCRKRPFVHAEEARGGARRTVPGECAVQPDAVNGGSRNSQNGTRTFRRVKEGAEFDKIVHASLATFRPDGHGNGEGRVAPASRRRQSAGDEDSASKNLKSHLSDTLGSSQALLQRPGTSRPQRMRHDGGSRSWPCS